MPRALARTIALARLVTPSLPKQVVRWRLTVLAVAISSAAMAWFERSLAQLSRHERWYNTVRYFLLPR